jgi:hypothetical protein
MKNRVPTSDTGTAIAGISVDLKSCKKRKTTINISKYKSEKYKIILEAPLNTTNRWFIKK